MKRQGMHTAHPERFEVTGGGGERERRIFDGPATSSI